MIVTFNNDSIAQTAKGYLEKTSDTIREKVMFIALLGKKDYLFDQLRKGLNYEENIALLDDVQAAINVKLEGGKRWTEV